MSTAIADDGDCDGTPTTEDCDDADPTSTTILIDGDCDGFVGDQDCDDTDPNSLTYLEDGDCDGLLTADDCMTTIPFHWRLSKMVIAMEQRLRMTVMIPIQRPQSSH